MSRSVDATETERTFGLVPGTFPYASRFVEIAGARVHYVDEGAGPVLLMLHGNSSPHSSHRSRRMAQGPCC